MNSTVAQKNSEIEILTKQVQNLNSQLRLQTTSNKSLYTLESERSQANIKKAYEQIKQSNENLKQAREQTSYMKTKCEN